ncbi:AAA family ATPase [Brucella anthropi]|uniref:AAA family ATPase n=1 Tax=Brucella anthropi TaxID=529 RepID=UPI00124D89DB|nr:AAA family ATPase [Brucella anthropi]KAB2770262.1 AAA family ATPase [Brucella anthropi]
MRLKSVTIEGFRGFNRRVTINLDADVIIMQGPNGVGKTSLLDAVLWALTGKIDRFADRGTPVSLYAREGIARVSLVLGTNDVEVSVTRATDGERGTLRLDVGGQNLEGATAENHLSELLLPHLRERSETASAVANVLTRGVYLQQDLVRQFIDTDTPSDRFQLISEVIGAGVVLELQSALEKSRLQWARNITSRRKERLEPLELQAARLDEQLTRLDTESQPEVVDARAASTQIYNEIVQLIGRARITLDAPPTTSGELDRLLKEVSGERSSLEREYTIVRALIEERALLHHVQQEDIDTVATLEKREIEKSTELSESNTAVEAALQEQSILQEKRLAEKNRIVRLATMARLALDDISGPCPVCQQTHDRSTTERHLHELIESAATDHVADYDQNNLRDVNARRNQISRELEAIRAQLNDAKTRQQEAAARHAIFESRLKDLGIPNDDSAGESLHARTSALEERIGKVAELQARGETLTLRVIRLGEQRRRAELEKERVEVGSKINSLQSEIAKLDKTHALAGRIIEALRRASLDVTRRQIENVQPLFQRIYSRIDPHPTFRLTQITAALERGKGLLKTGITDPDQGLEMHDALPILSSSQLNAFAVSLFLALNLGLPSLRLNLTMLDDPLQSLDAINLLGLVDVLRRFREHRQIIVSTHEPRLLGLLQRKMRPVRPEERMITLFFDSWNSDGPDFRAVTSEFEPDAVRVLAA